MQIGINWISPHTLPIIQQLISEGWVDFCEIMVDNVVHLPPAQIREIFSNVPLSLHIVASRFLEKSLPDLKQLAKQLKPWIEDLAPIYVSDHLAQFTSVDGKRLSMLAELNYHSVYLSVKQRVKIWQELLDRQILFENFASFSPAESQMTQPEFYTALIEETHCKLLFDFSNAYIADYNHVCSFAAWHALIQKTNHFHVAGFRVNQTANVAIDTHDVPIDDDVVVMINKTIFSAEQKNKTIVIEWDANISFDNWKHDIQKIKNDKAAYVRKLT